MKTICYTKPSISKLEVEYVLDAARNGWGKHCYDYIIKFEQLLKQHLDIKYAIAKIAKMPKIPIKRFMIIFLYYL